MFLLSQFPGTDKHRAGNTEMSELLKNLKQKNKKMAFCNAWSLQTSGIARYCCPLATVQISLNFVEYFGSYKHLNILEQSELSWNWLDLGRRSKPRGSDGPDEMPTCLSEGLQRATCQHTIIIARYLVKLHFDPPGSYVEIKDTQIAGKLVLSLDRNLIMEKTVHDGSIQFRVEFQNFKLSIDGETLIDLPARMLWDSPLVEITLGSGVDSPISEMEVDVTPLTTVPSTKEDKSQELIDEEFSQSEIGSSSSTLFVTSKNRKKNYLRRLRKRNFKARMIAESETFKQVKFEAKQEFVAPYTYPLPFAQRKEVVSRVAQSSMRLLDYYTKRINQDIIEPAPGIDHRPQVEGYDLSTLLEDIRSSMWSKFSPHGIIPDLTFCGKQCFLPPKVFQFLFLKDRCESSCVLSLGLDPLVVEYALCGTTLDSNFKPPDPISGKQCFLPMRSSSFLFLKYICESSCVLSLGLDSLVVEYALCGTILDSNFKLPDLAFCGKQCFLPQRDSFLSLGLDVLVVEYAPRGTTLVFPVSFSLRIDVSHHAFFLRIRSSSVEYTLCGTTLEFKLQTSRSDLWEAMLPSHEIIQSLFLKDKCESSCLLSLGLDVLVMDNTLCGTILISTKIETGSPAFCNAWSLQTSGIARSCCPLATVQISSNFVEYFGSYKHLNILEQSELSWNWLDLGRRSKPRGSDGPDEMPTCLSEGLQCATCQHTDNHADIIWSSNLYFKLTKCDLGRATDMDPFGLRLD
ncbi:hypothetical protein M5K25_027823 [Dendrobium thyrsiflorum]|uniref:Uncharacterized protein n=1 Tax=Dendrobium thyrsiflorum TaxID=117978 RepID=A0ABD0TV11_DENTH